MAKAKTNKADKPADKKPYKIIDVSHPGTVAADAASIPVIVTNRPVLKDPMMVENDENTEHKPEEEEAKPTLSTSKKIKIVPLGETSDDDKDPPKPATKSKKKQDKTIAEIADDEKKKHETIAELAAEADAKAAEKSDTEKQEDETPDSDEATGEADEPAEESVPDLEPDTDKEASADDARPQPADDDSDELLPTDEAKTDPKAAEAARKEAERQLALNKIAEAGTYALPINAVEKRKVRRFVFAVIVLMLLLGVAWVDLALDAQLIHVHNLNALTDFFPDR